MAIALEYAARWFREQNGWKQNECGVQYDALPPLDAGQFYVAIDDAGVEAPENETHSLKEILNLTVGIWRRPEHLTKDQRGILKLPSDKYLLGSFTLHDMERQVIIHRLKGLHRNYEFMNALNAAYDLPHLVNGAEFRTPLVYRGRGRMERVGFSDGSPNVQTWYGYRLRFRGLYREQKLISATDALG